MIYTTIVLLLVSFLQLSCNPSDDTLNRRTTVSSLPQSADNAGRCNPGSLRKMESCTQDIEHSANATRWATCSSDGQTETTACLLEGCLPGYDMADNKCMPMPCEANADLGNEVCTDSIDNAVSATRSKKCNASGSGFEFGECVIDSCEEGYTKVGSSCEVSTCTPNNNEGVVSCKDEIPDSLEAEKTKTCNDTGTGFDYGDCTLISCATNFLVQKNACVAQACQPKQSFGDVSCTDDISNSAEATKSKICNATGNGFIYGNCMLASCKNDYVKVGNACEMKACEPNSATSVSCVDQISNAKQANQTKSCNDDGTSFTLGSCSLVTCKDGYHKVSNSCATNTCTPNQAFTPVDCKSEIPNSVAATKTKSCNGEGSNFIYGSCQATKCATGYSVSNKICVEDDPIVINELIFSVYADDAADPASTVVDPGDSVVVAAGYRLSWSQGSTNRSFGSLSGGKPRKMNRTDFDWNVSGGSLSTSNIFNGSDYRWVVPTTPGSYTLTVTARDKKSSFGSDIVNQAIRNAANGKLTKRLVVKVPAPPAGDHVIFVSSRKYSGNLGGLAGADQKCKSLANAAGLSGNFKAVLSDKNNSAKSRLSINGKVKDTNDEIVFASASEMWNNAASIFIDRTERNTKLSSGTLRDACVITGTDGFGRTAGGNCSNWTSGNFFAGTAIHGLAGPAFDAGEWLTGGQCGSCEDSARLFCVSQP